MFLDVLRLRGVFGFVVDIDYFIFGPFLSRGDQSIVEVKLTLFVKLLRGSLGKSVDVGVSGTTHPLVWDLTPILFLVVNVVYPPGRDVL